MSRLLYQAELHRRVTARSGLSTGPVVVLVPTSPFTESNRRPSPYHGDALPTELKGRARERVNPTKPLAATGGPSWTVPSDCISRSVTGWTGPLAGGPTRAGDVLERPRVRVPP